MIVEIRVECEGGERMATKKKAKAKPKKAMGPVVTGGKPRKKKAGKKK